MEGAEVQVMVEVDAELADVGWSVYCLQWLRVPTGGDGGLQAFVILWSIWALED